MKKQEPFFITDKDEHDFFHDLETCRNYERPHSCPICFGRGIVQEGFYNNMLMGDSSSTCSMPETCRTCNGAGIVWR